MKFTLLLVFLFLSGPASAESFWTHNGSRMRLEADGDGRRMYYDVPRESLPVESGTLLFEGARDGADYSGTAYRFSSKCGPASYAVSGRVSDDEREIVLRGKAPKRDDNCNVVGEFADRLIFKFKSAGAAEPENVVFASSEGPVDPHEASLALDVLREAFRCPIKPITRKEVSEGVMQFYSSRVFSQRFLGDGERLKFSFTEEYDQKTEPGMGGTMKDSWVKEGDVLYQDLASGRIESTLSEADEKFDDKPITFRVVVNCSGNSKCFRRKEFGETSLEATGEAIFCDKATANNALMALEVLSRTDK